MILALRTGWTPDVIGSLSAVFRAACHWALYVHAIVGDEGLEDIPTPPAGSAPELRLAVGKARADRARLADILYPADE